MTALVFLHAGVADARSWPGPGTAYDRTDELDPVDELLAHLPDGPVALVGNSQGGRIAIEAALEHPGRFEALFLLAPAVAGAPGAEPLPDWLVPLSDAIDAAEEAGDLDEVNRLEAWLWLDGPSSPEGRVGGAARELFLAMNGALLRRGTEPPWRERPAAWDRLERLDLPVHVLVGDLDLPHVQDRCRTIAARVPGATRTVWEGVAHLPTLERPDEVVGWVTSALA